MCVVSLLFFSYFPLSVNIVRIEKININNVTIVTKECKIVLEEVYNIFGIMSVMIVYIIPYFVLGVLNVMIIFKINERSKRPIRRSIKCTTSSNKGYAFKNSEMVLKSNASGEVLVPPKSRENNLSILSNVSRGRNGSSSAKNDINLNITLIAVAITFIILTLPYQILWYYENFHLNSPSQREPNKICSKDYSNNEHFFNFNFDKLKELVFILKNMNYLINFILYSALSKIFRDEFIGFIKGAVEYRRQNIMFSKEIRKIDLGEQSIF